MPGNISNQKRKGDFKVNAKDLMQNSVKSGSVSDLLTCYILMTISCGRLMDVFCIETRIKKIVEFIVILNVFV